MHVETSRNIALYFVEELAELLRTVARHACADYAARLHVCLGRHGGNEACEECRCAVALVIVGAPLDLTRTHRQKRLRSIKGLYVRCGCKQKACQIRCTDDADTPAAFATPRVLQCVASAGFVSSVFVTISSIRSSPILRGAPHLGSSP